MKCDICEIENMEKKVFRYFNLKFGINFRQIMCASKGKGVKEYFSGKNVTYNIRS